MENSSEFSGGSWPIILLYFTVLIHGQDYVTSFQISALWTAHMHNSS